MKTCLCLQCNYPLKYRCNMIARAVIVLELQPLCNLFFENYRFRNYRFLNDSQIQGSNIIVAARIVFVGSIGLYRADFGMMKFALREYICIFLFHDTFSCKTLILYAIQKRRLVLSVADSVIASH